MVPKINDCVQWNGIFSIISRVIGTIGRDVVVTVGHPECVPHGSYKIIGEYRRNWYGRWKYYPLSKERIDG